MVCNAQQRRQLVRIAALLTTVASLVAGERQAVHAQGQVPVQQGRGPEVARTLRAAAPIDLTGYWVSVVTEDWRWRMVVPERGDLASVPVNAEARRVADNWDPQADESRGEQCKAYGAASLMRLPGRLNISWADDNTLRIQTDTGTQTRMLRFNSPPAGRERTWQGHSVASWQVPASAGGGDDDDGGGGARGPGAKPSGVLKVVTTNMRAGYLRKNGVPYSENTVLTEYFSRMAGPGNQEWLVVTSIVEDPQYLNKPFITSSHFKKEPDNSKWDATPCSTRSAR
jgi:hypothetical protein